MHYNLLLLILSLLLLTSCAGSNTTIMPGGTEEPQSTVIEITDSPDQPIAMRAPEGRQFTAATWNLHTLTMKTREKKANPFGLGKANRGDAVYDYLSHLSIEIVALQEVYLMNGEDPNTIFPIPASGGRYKMLKGTPIKPFSGDNKQEYCPIVYEASLLNCSTEHVGWESLGRSVHWAHCKVRTDTQKQFFFGCGHFDTDTRSDNNKLFANVLHFFDNLQKKKPRPTIGKHPGMKKDSFIFGVDANSSMYGKNKGYWKSAYEKWYEDNKTGNPPKVPQDIVFKAPKKNGTKGTKLNNNGGQVTYSGGGVIDELTWSLNPAYGISYNGDKEIVKPPHLQRYFDFSDHLIVKAEFSYAGGI